MGKRIGYSLYHHGRGLNKICQIPDRRAQLENSPNKRVHATSEKTEIIIAI